MVGGSSISTNIHGGNFYWQHGNLHHYEPLALDGDCKLLLLIYLSFHSPIILFAVVVAVIAKKEKKDSIALLLWC